MLLQELAKLTPNSHRDYTKLSEAIKTITDVAHTLNEDMKDKERQRATVAVCEQFEEMSLLSPSRLLVKEGNLQKICQHGKKTFRFVLFNDLIIYGREEMVKKKTSSGKKKHSMHR